MLSMAIDSASVWQLLGEKWWHSVHRVETFQLKISINYLVSAFLQKFRFRAKQQEAKVVASSLVKKTYLRGLFQNFPNEVSFKHFFGLRLEFFSSIEITLLNSPFNSHKIFKKWAIATTRLKIPATTRERSSRKSKMLDMIDRSKK